MAAIWNKDKKQQAIADMLPALIRSQGWEIQLDQHSIFLNWQNIVDRETGKHCLPLKISKGVLWIEVENSAWLQQMQYQKQSILDTVNASLRKSTLQGVKFSLPKGRSGKPPEKDPVLRFVPPAVADVDAFERQIAGIADEQCRAALLRFWYLAHACRKEEV